MKTLLEQLILIEDKLDFLNGEYGDEDGWCNWCKTKKYNGRVGLVHTKTCVITQIRNKIKELKLNISDK